MSYGASAYTSSATGNSAIHIGIKLASCCTAAAAAYRCCKLQVCTIKFHTQSILCVDRSQQPPQLKADNTRPSSKDAAERKARAKISYEVWKAENEKSGQAVDDKDQENRGSRHESAPHREHSRRQEASRHDQAAPYRETLRHHESPRRRDTARRREASPADHQPRPARPSPDGRRVTAVPRSLEADRALDRWCDYTFCCPRTCMTCCRHQRVMSRNTALQRQKGQHCCDVQPWSVRKLQVSHTCLALYFCVIPA